MNGTPSAGPPGPKNIADPFFDLLLPLDEGRRLGFIQRLAVGFYEQWRPTREEVAFLVDLELGRSTVADFRPRSGSIDTGLAADRAAADEVRPTNSPRADAVSAAHPLRSPLVGSSQSDPIRASNVPIATFSVDCGLLAPPLRFVACGLSSAGFTVRLGERYRRTFLHYRLMTAARPAVIRPHLANPAIFVANITCVPDISAPAAAEDGRLRGHATRAGIVTGSRGPWPVAEGVTTISFLIAAQAPVGARQRRHPAGTLQVDIRSGAATWRSAAGQEAGGDGHAVAQ